MLTSSLLRFARTTAPGAARRTLASAPAVATTNVYSDGPPSVYDKIIKVTIIDPSGARRIIPAMVGQTLYAACDLNGVDLGPASVGATQQKERSDTWTEPLYGEGATSGFDHVLLQGNNEGVELAEPPHSNEVKMLEKYWDEDEIFPESRLASLVEVNAKMDGMVVYVPDRLCDDIP
mmetsp:Transcript_9250/g.16741  ORF Transcript_9250/g.16741 Transcript_9250/m.16741 type:complete len:177 (-) Transcript_9250:616-1146(-)